MTQYPDLEVEIREDEVRLAFDGREYVATPDFDEESLARLVRLRREGEPDEYGWELFRCVFRDGAADGYRSAMQLAEERGQRWRFHLVIPPEAAALQSLWWECLKDRLSPRPLSLGRDANTPLSRYFPSQRQTAVAEELKVLAVISNPEDLGRYGADWGTVPRLDEAAEVVALNDALEDVADRVNYRLCTERTSLTRIRDWLKEGPARDNEGFHVLHLVGQGFVDQDRGYLLLENDSEATAAADERSLEDLVAGLDDLHLVILDISYATELTEGNPFVRMAARMVRDGVPAVLTMQHRVSTHRASFNKRLYRALVRPKNTAGMLDVAVNDARDTVFFGVRTGWDWTASVLFMSGDGRLFESRPVLPRPEKFAAAAGRVPADITTHARSSSPTLPARSAQEAEAEGFRRLLLLLGSVDSQTVQQFASYYIEGDLVQGGKVTEDRRITFGDGAQVGIANTGEGASIVQGVQDRFDAAELSRVLQELIASLPEEDLSDPRAQLGVAELNVAKRQTDAGEDPERIKGTLEFAAEHLKGAEEVLERGVRIGDLLKKAAKLVGAVIAWA